MRPLNSIPTSFKPFLVIAQRLSERIARTLRRTDGVHLMKRIHHNFWSALFIVSRQRGYLLRPRREIDRFHLLHAIPWYSFAIARWVLIPPLKLSWMISLIIMNSLVLSPDSLV